MRIMKFILCVLFCLAMLFLALVYLYVQFIFPYQYVGWRYRVDSWDRVYDYIAEGSVEDTVYAYEVDYPYMYVYGITGYSRVKVAPFSVDVIKVVNNSYYNHISKDIEPYKHSDLHFLRKVYGDDLYLSDSFSVFSEADIQRFKVLRQKGEIGYKYYMDQYKYKTYPFVDSEEGTQEIFHKLKEINKQLE